MMSGPPEIMLATESINCLIDAWLPPTKLAAKLASILPEVLGMSGGGVTPAYSQRTPNSKRASALSQSHRTNPGPSLRSSGAKFRFSLHRLWILLPCYVAPGQVWGADAQEEGWGRTGPLTSELDAAWQFLFSHNRGLVMSPLMQI